MKPHFLDVTQEAGAALLARNISGEVVMLNLLRFRDVADYSANPELMPGKPISGAEAYQKYIDHTLPFLRKSGGDLVFLGKGDRYLIGPQDEQWDLSCLSARARCLTSLHFPRIKSTWPVWGIEPPHWKIRACYRLLNRKRQHSWARDIDTGHQCPEWCFLRHTGALGTLALDYP